MAVVPDMRAVGTRQAADPADLFAELFDLLITEVPRPGAVDDLDVWLLELEARGVASEVEQSVVAGNGVGSLAGSLPEPGSVDRTRRLYEVLVGLDRALGFVHPDAGGHAPALAPLVARLVRSGRLSSSAVEGAVLPRSGVLPQPPPPLRSWNDCFEHVLRISAHAWSETQFVPLRLRHRLVPPEGHVRVGLLPLVDRGDVQWLTRETTTGPRYSVRPHTKHVGPRLTAALAALDDARVDIAALPEAGADAGLLELWQQAVLRTPPPPGSRLQWILIGTGPATEELPAPNRAWIIHRHTGDLLGWQDKRNPFRIECDLAERWRVDTLLPGLPCDEDITLGDRPRVFDGGRARVSVLVCEDLASVMDNGESIIAFSPTHVFVPVVSDSVDPERWQHKESEQSFGDSRTAVIVSNGLALRDVAPPGSDFNTGLVFQSGQPIDVFAARAPLEVSVVDRVT